MKNWLTIGQFAKEIGVSAKALRLYEDMGLLHSHVRGENGYRYYDQAQLETARRLKEFKDLGFTLIEIKALLESDQDLDSTKLSKALQSRLSIISQQAELLQSQKEQIETILSSLKKKNEPLAAEQRRAIMTYYGKVSILVTGCDGLEKTAQFIQKHYQNANQELPILQWSPELDLPEEKPYILILPERDLIHNGVSDINADVIVIKSISNHTADIEEKYLRLYAQVGPHSSTVINADDRASVALAGNEILQKGCIYYYSKNRALEPQLKNIGGILSDGEDLEIFGFNRNSTVRLQLNRILGFQEEIALLSSYAAVIAVGLQEENLTNTFVHLKENT
ncbi:MAG: MerR family transcriptional regulator [Bacillota bacterium]